VDGTVRDGFIINLSNETLTIPPNYTIRSFSLDGGLRWREARPEMFNKVRFPRFLDRGMTLSLSDSSINPITKQPFDNLNVVNFPLIRRRPQIFRLNVNYAIRADATGATAGRWVLASPASTRKRADETEFTGNIEIGLAFDTRTVDKRGFGLMPRATALMPHGGMPVLTYREFGYRVTRTRYLIRIPPQTATQAGTPGYTFTPASRSRLINISSELAPPRYSISTTRQLLRLRGGESMYHGSERNLSELLPPPIPGLIPTPAQLINLEIFHSWHNPASQRTDIPTAGFAGGLTIWRVATPARPATAKQMMIPSGTPPNSLLRTAVITTPVAINGAVGADIVPQRFTIDLTNAEFLALTANDDVSDWFRPPNASVLNALPDGLFARVFANVLEGDSSVTIEMYGNPNVPASFIQIAGSIPNDRLVNSSDPIQIIRRSEAVYVITQFTDRSARLRNWVSFSGNVNTLITTTLTIDLTNATFVSGLDGQDVGSSASAPWITNLPDNTNAVITSYTVDSVTIQISGTPTIAYTANMAIQIPAQFLESSTTPLQVNTMVSGWGYSNYSIQGIAVISAGVVNGQVNQAITGQTFTITLTGDEFNASAAVFTNPITTGNANSWFANRPTGLNATVVSGTLTANSVQVEISGTPSTASHSRLSNGSNIGISTWNLPLVYGSSISFTSTSNARYEINRDVNMLSPSSIHGRVGVDFSDPAALALHGLNEALITAQLIGDTFTGTVIPNVSGLPAGVSTVVRSGGTSGSNLITIAFVGEPSSPSPPGSPYSITITIPSTNFNNDRALDNPLIISATLNIT
jgi:hypothetical protein